MSIQNVSFTFIKICIKNQVGISLYGMSLRQFTHQITWFFFSFVSVLLSFKCIFMTLCYESCGEVLSGVPSTILFFFRGTF